MYRDDGLLADDPFDGHLDDEDNPCDYEYYYSQNGRECDV
jgi:hypothetical protein